MIEFVRKCKDKLRHKKSKVKEGATILCISAVISSIVDNIVKKDASPSNDTSNI